MSVNKQQASEFLNVIHQRLTSNSYLTFPQEQLSMKEMGLVYSDMGDK